MICMFDEMVPFWYFRSRRGQGYLFHVLQVYYIAHFVAIIIKLPYASYTEWAII